MYVILQHFAEQKMPYCDTQQLADPGKSFDQNDMIAWAQRIQSGSIISHIAF